MWRLLIDNGMTQSLHATTVCVVKTRCIYRTFGNIISINKAPVLAKLDETIPTFAVLHWLRVNFYSIECNPNVFDVGWRRHTYNTIQLVKLYRTHTTSPQKVANWKGNHENLASWNIIIWPEYRVPPCLIPNVRRCTPECGLSQVLCKPWWWRCDASFVVEVADASPSVFLW